MKSLLLNIALLGALLSTTVAHAQAPCATQKAQCESECKSQAKHCDSAPPTGLIRDPGPEPAKTTEVFFSTVGAGVTSRNEFGWQPTQAGAQTLATDMARNIASQACVSGGGRFHSTKMVVADPCQSKQEMGTTVWNCSVTLTGDCRREEPNPAHAAWLQTKRESENDAKQVDGRKTDFDRCHAQRNADLNQCASRCANICSGGAGGVGGQAGTNMGAGGSAGGDSHASGTGGGGEVSGDSQPNMVSVEPPAWQTQQQQDLKAAQQKLNQNVAELADMTGKVSPKVAIAGLAMGLGVTPLMKGFVANGATIALLLLPTFLTVMGVLPTLAAKYNSTRYAAMKVEYQPAIDAAQQRCNGGEMPSCREAQTLVDVLHDAGSRGGQRRAETNTFGPSLSGPGFGTRYTASFFSETANRGYREGDNTGGAVRTMIRLGVGVFGLEAALASVANDDRGVRLSGSGIIGVQLGSGLASPYALLVGRVHAGAFSDRQAPVSTDAVLELGNTFDMTPIWSTRGPFVVAPVVDLALTLPLSGEFEPGYRIGVGVNMARFWPAKIEAANQSVGSSPRRAETYADVLMPYLMSSGGGLQIFRMNGVRSKQKTQPRQIITMIDAWVGSGDSGWRAGGYLGGMGMRGRSNSRRFEWGFVVGLAGIDFREREEGSIFGLFPTKMFARYAHLPVDIEVGLMSPLVWADVGIGEGNTFSLYESFSLNAYLGIGFPMNIENL